MNDVQIPISSNFSSDTDYLETCNQFLKSGFTNITLIPQYDVKFYEGSKSGAVQSVKVGGKGNFTEGDWLPNDIEVRITYRMKNLDYLDKNYKEVHKILESMGFKSIEYLAMNDLDYNELKKDGEVASVLIGDVELSKAEELNLLQPIVINYHSEKQVEEGQVKITTSSKDLTGENYESVVSALQEMGFTSIKTVALEDLSNEILHKDGTVSEISIEGETKFSIGQIFNKNAETIVSYHSFKPEPEPSQEPEAEEGQIKISVTSKELKGKDYQEVLTILQEMGFTNIKTNPLGDIKKGWFYDDGEVKEVRIGNETKFSLNDIFDADVEIIITYHSYKD